MARKFLPAVMVIFLFVNACVSLPDSQPVDRVVHLDQNWQDPSIANYFHHTSQGTRILPRDWFMALEQPELSFFGDPSMFHETEYLSRFGFIPDTEKTPYNPDGLPLGFAVDDQFVDPMTNKKSPVVGLTCAACHTGELHVVKDGKRLAVRIEGGPAMMDPGLFQDALSKAIAYTYYVPGRFDRFARKVLKEHYSEENAEQLHATLKNIIEAGKKMNAVNDELHLYDVKGGFSRTDALGRILNVVFGEQLNVANLAPASAPVNFPFIWDASWFDWVQYNGSIHQPMVRNAGEALGVRAPADFKQREALYKSTVRVDNLAKMERWLAGDPKIPLSGLSSPKWPENILGTIDRDLAKRGEALYKQEGVDCQGCHLPPMDQIRKEWQNPSSPYWTRRYGPPLLRLVLKNVDYIKTDRTLLENFNNRKVVQPDALQDAPGFIPIKKGMGMGLALGDVVENVVNRWYDDQQPPTPAAVRKEMNGDRKNLIRAPMGYKARPLNGVWATAPFLHNGSVPNLYELLSPVDERSKTFFLGSKEFDPVKIGFSTQPLTDGFEFDVSSKGNFNSGHEFNGDGKELGNGVIGRKLSHDERMALIEYLKTL